MATNVNPTSTPMLEYDSQVSVLKELWTAPQPHLGQAAHEKGHINHDELAAYFRYWHEQQSADTITISHAQLTFLAGKLKQHVGSPRRFLKQKLSEIYESQNEVQQEASDRSLDLPPTEGSETAPGLPAQGPGHLDNSEIDMALDLVVRLVFAVSITHDSKSISPGISRVDWEDGQSLKDFMLETFPTYTATDLPTTRLRATKLRASYLEAYAGIDFSWTDHLCDHLSLSTNEHRKVLKIFRLPCFIEASYSVAYAAARILHDENISNDKTIADGTSLKFLETLDMGKSLERGFYPPSFLLETLMTYRILFPSHDAEWLRRKMKPKAKWLSSSSSSQRSHELDKRLAFPFEKDGIHKRPLTNRRELYQRFPHWALRLDILYEEAEDPTPTSWIGRWSERRKGARHSFWMTFVAFVVAILFGIVATALAAIQLWVAYCDWQGENGTGLCRN